MVLFSSGTLPICSRGGFSFPFSKNIQLDRRGSVHQSRGGRAAPGSGDAARMNAPNFRRRPGQYLWLRNHRCVPWNCLSLDGLSVYIIRSGGWWQYCSPSFTGVYIAYLIIFGDVADHVYIAIGRGHHRFVETVKSSFSAQRPKQVDPCSSVITKSSAFPPHAPRWVMPPSYPWLTCHSPPKKKEAAAWTMTPVKSVPCNSHICKQFSQDWNIGYREIWRSGSGFVVLEWTIQVLITGWMAEYKMIDLTRQSDFLCLHKKKKEGRGGEHNHQQIAEAVRYNKKNYQ